MSGVSPCLVLFAKLLGRSACQSRTQRYPRSRLAGSRNPFLERAKTAAARTHGQERAGENPLLNVTIVLYPTSATEQRSCRCGPDFHDTRAPTGLRCVLCL